MCVENDVKTAIIFGIEIWKHVLFPIVKFVLVILCFIIGVKHTLKTLMYP